MNDIKLPEVSVKIEFEPKNIMLTAGIILIAGIVFVLIKRALK